MRTLLTTTAILAALALSACGPSTLATKEEPATTAAATEAAASTDGQSSLTVAPQGALAANQPVTLTMTLKDASGAPLGPDAIATSHTQKVHVMIVDAGLEDYTHAHATPGAAPGEWTVSFTPKFARTYRVWTDFKLATGEEAEGHSHGEGGHAHGEGGHAHDGAAKSDEHGQTPSATLTVGTEASPAVAPTQALSGEAGGLKFSLSLGGPATADAHVPATLVVTEAAGQPFAGLEPIMGAYAHLVGFSADGSTMVHAHPQGAEPTEASARGGPALTFELHPTVAGPNRLFLQVQKDGAVITLPFTLMVGN
jgi:hypothetical protein